VTITLDSLVRDVLADCPAAGELFIQHGRFSRHERGALYPSYDPRLTVGAFAVKAGTEPLRLLALLRAAAEDCDHARHLTTGIAGRPPISRPRWSPPRTLGYTGSYRESSDEIEVRPVVEVQSAQGPI
jgi:hypothetical protein